MRGIGSLIGGQGLAASVLCTCMYVCHAFGMQLISGEDH